MEKTIEQHIEFLLAIISNANFETSIEAARPEYLTRFVLETQIRSDLPSDKRSRWVGYVYGVLLKHDVISSKDFFVFNKNVSPDILHPISKATLEVLEGLRSDVIKNNLEPIYPEANGSFIIDTIPYIGLNNENERIVKMIDAVVNHAGTLSYDQISVYLGAIQGYLVASEKLDVIAERERTRPIFHRAYKELGILPPKSVELKTGD